MKTKVARRIAKALGRGDYYPQHIVRKVSLALGCPILCKTSTGDLIYHPKELTGSYSLVAKYRPYSSEIVKTRSDLRDGYDYARALDSTPGKISLQVSAGCCISEVCGVTTRTSSAWRAKIEFDFNGIPVKVSPFQDRWDVEQQWQSESKRRHEEYLNSDEYKAYLLERQAELKETQSKLDALLTELPSLVKDESLLMAWCGNFADIADDVGLVWSKSSTYDILSQAGWVEDAECIPKYASDEEKKIRKAALATFKPVFARWVVGQVMNCLGMGMPPHPITRKFVDEYFAPTETLDAA